MTRVFGWSGPSTRSRSVSRGLERAGGAGYAAPGREVVAGGQGMGVVGAQYSQLIGEQVLACGGGAGPYNAQPEPADEVFLTL